MKVAEWDRSSLLSETPWLTASIPARGSGDTVLGVVTTALLSCFCRSLSLSGPQSDGTLLATGSYDGFARIWTEDGESCLPRVGAVRGAPLCVIRERTEHDFELDVLAVCFFVPQVTWPAP